LSSPQQIALGPDGNFWFTGFDPSHSFGPALGRITPAGVVTAFDFPAQSSAAIPYGIATGPDGNLWFTERREDKIGVMSTAGVLLHEFTIRSSPPQFFQLFLITRGPDGNMWFTESDSKVGRITPAGVVTEFPITAPRQPFGITAGPDGRIWMALQGGIAGVARINVNGTGYKEFPDPNNGFPNRIVAGKDGNLWFTDYADSAHGGNQIGRVTPAGQITEFSAGLPANGQPTDITPGPDGRLWFTLSQTNVNEVGAITTK
jgi:streptogramin lyase